MTAVDIDAMTLAQQADALCRAGYPDPLESSDDCYVPTRTDIERAVRGEGPPPGWRRSHLCQEALYVLLGGTDRGVLAEMRQRDRETARLVGVIADEQWSPGPPLPEPEPEPGGGLLARLIRWLRP